jgi:hypothetical protein
MHTFARMFSANAFELHAILIAASRKKTLAHRVLHSRYTIAKDFTMGFFASGINL